jgi:heat shock protein HtpX
VTLRPARLHASPALVRRPLAPLDAAEQRRHKLRNLLQSVLLLAGMVGLLAVCGWLLFGPDGVVGMGLGAALALALAPRISPQMVLRLYHARELERHQLPPVHQVLARLSERAGLERVPRLYYVPSAMLNAFAVGSPKDAAIALTDGMLRHLDLRELTGVLAHEISHVRNRDLWLMNLADLTGRLTRMMSLLGFGLLIIGLPMWLGGAGRLPWLLVPLLMFAPQLTMLLQLALSRSREFDADLDAAGLTGDPAGLASALAKLERHQRGLWERILLPGRQLPEPSLLRSHPPTEERIARLAALSGATTEPGPAVAGLRATPREPIVLPWQPVRRPARGHLLGFWY